MNQTRRRFLEISSLAASALALRRTPLLAQATQADARIDILPSEPIATIAPEIYSHFIEHLGGVIYDGVWVGEKSKVPNTRGIRTSFIDAMRTIQAPVLRWPGGCFAESYDWRDGIGPAAKRPGRSAFWDQEDTNAYGTHEFLATCRAIGCQPYLAAICAACPRAISTSGSSTATPPPALATPLPTSAPLTATRSPSTLISGASAMRAGAAAATSPPRSTASSTARSPPGTPNMAASLPPVLSPAAATTSKLIACGPNGDDVPWTRGIMKSITASHLPWGLSVHYYTSGDAKHFAHGDALQFSPDEHYDLLTRGSYMENVITNHWAALGEVDTNHRVKLVVDEWGAWYGKGTELGPQYNLSQQSTMRDALLTGITLDIFQRHADKMAMANVAQTINCIHSLMLAREDKFTLTPTFHVFQMYLAHRGAMALRTEFSTPTIENKLATLSPVGGASNIGSTAPIPRLAGLSGSASISGKIITLTVVNPHLDQPLTTEIALHGMAIGVRQRYCPGERKHSRPQ